MKALKIIGIIVGLILLVFIVKGLTTPKEANVERSIAINAPKEVVWEMISKIRNHDKWGPWREQDTAMVVTYEGEDGQPGFKSSWTSDKAGSGSQTIASVVPGESIETDLLFTDPYESHAKGSIKMTESEDGIHVLWGFKMDQNFMMRAMSLFMSMDDAVGKEFEKGLNNLKRMCEEMPAKESTSYDIVETDFPGKSFMAHRETINMDKIYDFYSVNMAAVFKTCGENRVAVTGPASGIYYTWDEATKQTDVAAAVPVAADAKAVGSLTRIDLPARKALLIDFYGGYQNIMSAHNAMDDFMKAKGLKYAPPVLEEYTIDGMAEKDTAKWLTKIYYFYE